MSTYNPYSYQRPTPPRTVRWPLVLLVILGGVLGLLLLDKGFGWKIWPHQNGGGLPIDAQPRPVEARGSLSQEEAMTIDIYKKTSLAVVHVSNIAERRGVFNLNEQEVRGTGSGFVWDVGDDGSAIIVTNTHVVQGADAVTVFLNDKERSSFDTQYWVTYPDKDLAVLYVKAPKEKLHKIPWIGSSSDLQVGQRTFAIGNPFGLDQTLTTGIVSALDREIKSANGRPIQGVIQTSAAINPGNSGGPLLDSAGRLIGVNTAILSPSGTFAGIGFAIPVDEVNRVIPQLITRLKGAIGNNQSHEEVSPPRLGVVLVSDQLARQLGVDEGVLIREVVPNSPAAKAGLQSTRRDPNTGRVQLGDVIVAIDSTPVKSMKDVFTILGQHKVGDELTLTLLRHGEQVEVKIKLAAL